MSVLVLGPRVPLYVRPTVEQVRAFLTDGADVAVLVGWDIPPTCRHCGIPVDPAYGDPLPYLCSLCNGEDGRHGKDHGSEGGAAGEAAREPRRPPDHL